MTLAGFDWDDGNWPKCAKHGVSRQEIEHVLLNDPAVMPDRQEGLDEARFNAVGRNEDGRHLFVVFTFRRLGGSLWLRPISARYMHTREIKRYEQR